MWAVLSASHSNIRAVAYPNNCTSRIADTKADGEGPFDPVAPALANALTDATSIRFRALPLGADRIYHAINEELADRT
jgi:CO/xanthine dehydrogenase Mo-binding subunit